MKPLLQLGALVGFQSGGGQVGLCPAGETTGEVRLLLVPPHDAASRMVDRATGGDGYGHVVMDLGERTATGVALVVDCQPGYGAVRTARSFYEHRKPQVVRLAPEHAAWARDAVLARLGQPYDLRREGGVSCATMAYRALPPILRGWVDREPARGVAGNVHSPNRLARALGVA